MGLAGAGEVQLPPNRDTAMDHQQAVLKVLGRDNEIMYFLTRDTPGIHAKTSTLAATRRAQVPARDFGRARNCTRRRRLLA